MSRRRLRNMRRAAAFRQSKAIRTYQGPAAEKATGQPPFPNQSSGTVAWPGTAIQTNVQPDDRTASPQDGHASTDGPQYSYPISPFLPYTL
ncbi:MAG: hypothetical protein ACRERD_16410 [Candidatus Binatia bacterium]